MILNIFSPKFINLCPYFLRLFLFILLPLVSLHLVYYLILLIASFAIFLTFLFLVCADLIAILHKMVLCLSFCFIGLNWFVILYYFQFIVIQVSFGGLVRPLVILIKQSIFLLMINLVNQTMRYLFEILNFKLNFLKLLSFLIIQLSYSIKVNIIEVFNSLVEV